MKVTDQSASWIFFQETLGGFHLRPKSHNEPESLETESFSLKPREKYEHINLFLFLRTVLASRDGLRRIRLHQERTLRPQYTLHREYDYSCWTDGDLTGIRL